MSSLSSITTRAPSLPSRVYLYAPEKWGKTSFAAYAPGAVFLMSEGETGLLTLLESGQIPDTPHFPEDCRTWEQLRQNVRALIRDPHEFKTLVIDTANGAERLLSSWVLQHEFGGISWGKDGYNTFGNGSIACVRHWVEFLRDLDDLRVKRKMSILLLAHSKIKTVNNPEGPDYDQLRPEGIDKLWTLTHKWADIIAAGCYTTMVKDDKVSGIDARVIKTSGTLAAVCGNRYGLPPTIPCGANAKTAFQNFVAQIAKAKANGKRPDQQSQVQPTQQPTPQAKREPGIDDDEEPEQTPTAS
jgi:hypothetical protein